MSKLKCPYENCKFKCSSEFHHRARYAHISAGWKKKVKYVDKKMKKKRSSKVNWEKLKELGIIPRVEHEHDTNSDTE